MGFIRYYSRILLLLILALGSLSTLTAVSAQNDESFPACSEEEVQSTFNTLQDFTVALSDLSDRIQNATEAELQSLTSELNELQIAWWTEIAATIPNCTPTVEISDFLGRSVDELLIALLLEQAGYSDLAADHDEQFTSLNEGLANYVSNVAASDQPELQVTNIQRVEKMGMMEPKNPGDILVIIDFRDPDPEQQGPDICGTLQDATGNSWKMDGINLNSDGSVSGCIFAVPETATGLEWHPEGYSSVVLDL